MTNTMDGAAGESKAGRYDFAAVEARWQGYWADNQTFRVTNPSQPGGESAKPKYYILDFFPYPSGAGLHVGHPLGYCATDIISRTKRMQGYNVLHPMGFDAFGLPAEQYAIETGVHPAVTTKKNIDRYREQLQRFGFSYDWSRELATCDPEYYRFTQWIFLQLFNSWYDDTFRWTDSQGQPTVGRARPISELEARLESGVWGVSAALELVRDRGDVGRIEWSELSEQQKRDVLSGCRLAYRDEVSVNWCPALGTVLSNEEVDNEGRSERGNHPVSRRALRQWNLRITRYADRLLADLDDLDWPEPIKLMQRNWIGRSTGADVVFPLADHWAIEDGQWKCACGSCPPPRSDHVPYSIRVFTTRPDTLFGATYMVLAPEHELVEQITTADHRAEVEAYVAAAKNRSELDRTAESKQKTGVFTGAYAINPVNGLRVPIWIADYVLTGYGTGAIMAVPGHDARDFAFAKAFELPIVAVVVPEERWFHAQIGACALDAEYCARRGKADLCRRIMESATSSAAILGGITAQDASAVLDGDAGWLKQVLLPAYVDDPGIFALSFDGEGASINSPNAAGGGLTVADSCGLNGLSTPKAKEKITKWLETHGMGRAAVNYRLRDWLFSRQRYWGEPFPILHGEENDAIAVNEEELPVELPEVADFTPQASDDPNAPIHLPLSRAPESWRHPARYEKKLLRDLNTMPQWAGSCWYYLRFIDPANESRFTDAESERYWMPVDLYVGGAEHAVLHLLYARFWPKVLFDLGYVSTREPFKKLFNQGMIQGFAYENARGLKVGADDVEERAGEQFVLKSTGEPIRRVVAKMSKSLRNVVNPDKIIAKYGADTFRLYEMYMGPLESSKPWNTRDVPGLHKLCQRVWRLVVDEHTNECSPGLSDREPDAEELRMLHKTIHRVTEDIEQIKLNTAIAAIFDFVNFLTPRRSKPRAVVEPFLLLLSPFAPHLAEELWNRLGHGKTLAYESWPKYDERLARDEEVEIGVQIGGKIKARIMVSTGADDGAVRAAALANDRVAAVLEGKTVRKVIVVKGRLVNIIAG